MLRAEFFAAKERSEPWGINDTAPDARGNAFAGSGRNRDHEANEVMRNVLMGNAEDASSIAGVNMRLSAQFAEMSGSKERRSQQDRLLYMQTMMGRMLEDLNAQLAQIDWKLQTLDEIQQLMAKGTFDPAENEDHLEMLQAVDPDMTLEQWNAMSEGEKSDWVVESAARLNEERAQTQDAIQKIADPECEIEATNNRYDNPKFEEAAARIEARTGQEFDRHNLMDSGRLELIQETYIIRLEQIQCAEQLQCAAKTTGRLNADPLIQDVCTKNTLDVKWF